MRDLYLRKKKIPAFIKTACKKEELTVKMSEVLRIKNINKSYEVDGKRHQVFDDLNLEINPDEITVLIGKSGCGKTTLLRMIAGLEEPDSGMIEIPENLKIGMVFQEPRLMPWLNAEKNVCLGLKSSKNEAADILRLVGLEGFEKAYPRQLSGGMKQRVSLARTLIRKCNLILMDEPFSSLDDATKSNMLDEILKIKKETGAGFIFVTHDTSEAIAIGDRIISIKEKNAEETK